MAYSDYGEGTTSVTSGAYSDRIFFIIFRPVARVISLVLLSIGAILAYVNYAPWRYSPPDVHASLALDRLAHDYADTRRQPLRAAFKAFMERALTHSEYSAGHFDPGRSFA